ncbi:DUF4097 family beta strand repeat-containing protein [Agromyces sp. Soil535]|uniref:DUF4097 family beta strand repeat-containing protein n=1 Tax=Agromyces sp. Soil535 TaxID=1736390 RepID=UPI0006FBC7BF|nr:DUF4097 family beta strand repeat-containing protein [Agromyces sp. Soil535]
MNRFMRASVAAAATVMVVGTFGGCALLAPPHRFSDETTVSGEIRAIELVDPSGSVTVRGVEGATETTVERTVSYRGERSFGETHELDGDTLELHGCGRRCSVDYTIDVPAGVDVSGSTSNGAIKLRAVGEVDVETNNGRIELEDVAGGVQAETSNGRIDGRDLSGDGVRVSTSNGAIELSLGEPQDVEASTSNGAIEVTVPPDSYRVLTDTSNGSTEIGVPNDPDGAFTLDLRTSNGSITVTED